MPYREIRLVRCAIAVLVRMLELVERGVLGVEQTSVAEEEVVVDCADASGEVYSAPEVVRFGHGHLPHTCRAQARALGMGDGTPPRRRAVLPQVTVSSPVVYGRLTPPGTREVTRQVTAGRRGPALPDTPSPRRRCAPRNGRWTRRARPRPRLRPPLRRGVRG